MLLLLCAVVDCCHARKGTENIIGMGLTGSLVVCLLVVVLVINILIL